MFLLGIWLTHLYRYTIIKLRWLEISMAGLLPRVLLACLIFGIVMFGLREAVNLTLFDNEPLELFRTIGRVINWLVVWGVWSLVYFVFYFFQNHRKEEFKNLQWEASRNEIELNNLKAQLNPHFMFNAMNSIRALIDDHPNEAKDAVTQLANILRNGLLLGKKKVVLLEQEMHIVRDYLALEKVRYEERLNVEYELDEGSEACHIPPLMVQTIVENGIKHGISKLPKGGVLKIVASTTADELCVRVINAGIYRPSGHVGTGIGLKNTQKRLELLYGKKATFRIYNDNGNVVTEVNLPKQLHYEDHHN
jgi:two-component system LytT family sensor kinase